MAKKETGESRAAGPNAQAFTVVLEDLRGQFSVFGESLHGLRQEMERRFDVVDQRFEAVDRRFDAMDRRSDAMDQRFGRVDRDLGLLKTAVLDNSRELKAVGQAVAAMAGALDEKVDRAEVEEIVERVLDRRGR
jgi:septal ring factor EnvC (AmiA/AmiB activator)